MEAKTFGEALNREYGYTLTNSEQKPINRAKEIFFEYLKKDLGTKARLLSRSDLADYFTRVDQLKTKATDVNLLVESAKPYITQYFPNIDPEELAISMLGLLLTPPQRKTKTAKPDLEKLAAKALGGAPSKATWEQSEKLGNCPRGQIRNPKTNRCVNRNGVIGRAILSPKRTADALPRICHCKTKAGAACTRPTKQGEKYCWQHKDCKDPI